jgi:hypothetical protein
MMKTPHLLLAMFLALSGVAQAQAPSGNSTEDQVYQQRRNDLRSALSVSTRPADAAPAPSVAPRQLSADQRKELRQQLRQQYKQPPRAKP